MNTAIYFLIGYFLLMLLIGLWATRRASASEEDFLLAGRSLGPAVTALRLQSSSMSGYMFQGAGSLGYTQGYFGMWYALGDLGGGILNLSIIGRRMRRLSQMLGSVTSIEYLGNRYNSRLVQQVGAVVALVGLFLYLLAQFVAGGSGLAAVTGINFQAALLISAGIIVAYTFLGGYLAVAYTDFVQAIVMVVGMVWILVATVAHVGGFQAGNVAVGTLNENLLSMFGAQRQYEGQWGLILGALLVFSIGYMGWPHVVVSHMAMRSPTVVRKASVYSMIFNFLFIPSPYLIGVLALVIVPGLANPELALFEVSKVVLPTFAVGIVMAAVMAAIMSTADALLLQASTIVSRDIAGRFLPASMSPRTHVWVSRVTVLAMSAAAIALALWQPPSVLSMALYATTILGSSFAPAYICAVWWKKANSVGALASIIAGAVASVSWDVVGLTAATNLDPMVAGLGASTLAMVLGSLATQKSHPVPDTITRAITLAAAAPGSTKNTSAARLARGEDAQLLCQMPNL